MLPGELWDLSSEAQMIDAFPFIFFSLIKIICADYRKIRTVQTLKKKNHDAFVVLVAQRKPA